MHRRRSVAHCVSDGSRKETGPVAPTRQGTAKPTPLPLSWLARTSGMDPLRTFAKVGFGELRQCHDRRKAWSGWRVKPAANTRSHNESTPVARCSNRPGAFRGLRLHDIIRRKISARMPVPTEYQVKG